MVWNKRKPKSSAKIFGVDVSTYQYDNQILNFIDIYYTCNLNHHISHGCNSSIILQLFISFTVKHLSLFLSHHNDLSHKFSKYVLNTSVVMFSRRTMHLKMLALISFYAFPRFTKPMKNINFTSHNYHFAFTLCMCVYVC